MNMDLLGRSSMQLESMSGMSQMSSSSGMSEMTSANMGEMSDSKMGASMSGASMSMEQADGASNMPSMETSSANDMSEDMEMSGEMSKGMDMQNGMGMDMQMDMDMPMMRFAPLFGMWAVMMAAMMLPTMVPTLRSYEDLMKSANGTRGGWIGVLLGYFLIWVIFAAVITVAQLMLLRAGWIDMMGQAQSLYISAGLLIAAGAFQFTKVKEICHGVCHSPMTYFLGHWKAGAVGGFRMGLGLGAFCVGCCWLIMALGFAGGVMNFLWMGLATLFMVLEKLPELGHRVMRPMGGLLVAGGLGLVIYTFQIQGVV